MVATVEASSPLFRNVCSPPFVTTPVLCGYWPLRIEALEGQHSDSLTYVFGSDIPRSRTRSLIWGIAFMVSCIGWSSVMTNRMLGRSVVAGDLMEPMTVTNITTL